MRQFLATPFMLLAILTNWKWVIHIYAFILWGNNYTILEVEDDDE